MAKFKVGQRVRIIGPSWSAYLGFEATILRYCRGGWLFSTPTGVRTVGAHYDVCVDGIGQQNSDGEQLAYEPCELAPLTDPKADAFIERVKKWKPEPDPVALPVRATETHK